MINFKGEPLVKFHRPEIRGFNKEEVKKILKVGFCLKCHKENSFIFKSWKPELRCSKVKVAEFVFPKDF